MQSIKAQAAAVSRVAIKKKKSQAVEACSTGQAASLQTGSACEDREIVMQTG